MSATVLSASSAEMPERVLVIRLGALGNMVLSLGPFAAIRRHHQEATITLLTTEPYTRWMACSPYFDRICTHGRPAWWDARGWLRLRRQLRSGRFDWVYDLQTSARSSRYFRFFSRSAHPRWSGIARGCSHPDRDPMRDTLHDIERQAGQLHQAGIAEVPPADLSWCGAEIAQFELPVSIALLVPGSSAHRLAKRWPARRYGALARALTARGLTPVVLGSAAEQGLAAEIASEAPVMDLTGRTDFGEIVSLARAARLAVGNDTGPMHLIAVAGCPSLVLFSHESDPALCAPRGPHVSVLRRSNLDGLEVEEVLAAATYLLAPQVAAS
jgi:ADP-heptose:LPS heptosyltransferase